MEPSSHYHFDIVAFARDRLGFHADPHQARALDPFIRRGLLNCCRQWGKSTTISIRAAHQALHWPGSLTVVVAPSARQSAEFVRKAAQFLHSMGTATGGGGTNSNSLTLPNGSRIVGLPGKEATIRGFSNVALLLIDEASRVPDALYHAVRPMTVANRDSSIWLLSTPNGQQGFFYQEWTQGGGSWTRIQVPATECPRISTAALDDERRRLPQDIFNQEYMCEFTRADDSYFDPQAIEDAFKPRHEHGWIIGGSKESGQ